MFRQGWTIKSRLCLLALASVGNLLCYTQTFFGLQGWPRVISSLAGIAIFVYVLRVCFTSWSLPERTSRSERWNGWKVAASALSAITLLATGHFLSATAKIHALENGIGWLLVLLCQTFPDSRWKEVAFLGAYVIVLISIPWRQFFNFGAVPARFLAVIIAGWIVLSGSIFLFLMRRKSHTSQPELH